MSVLPLSKCRLTLEIKRVHFNSKRVAKNTVDYFQENLGLALGENFHLLDFEAGYSFRLDMLHNANAAIGYGGNPPKKFVMASNELERFLKKLSACCHDENILVYSNYFKIMPYVVTKLSSFVDNHELFIELMENEIFIVSEDLSQYIEINADNLQSLDSVGVGIIGERYLKCISSG